MIIPKQLKIGNLTYKIEEMDGELSNAKGVFGDSSVAEQRIRIGKYLTQEKKEETFIHEIVHSVMEHSGHFQESENEKLVKALANGIYQILRENGLLKK